MDIDRFFKNREKSGTIYFYFTEPYSLITPFANIASELRTAIKRLDGRGVLRLLMVAGCWLLVINASFGQVVGDFRTNGNVTFVAAANWERYNGAWVAAAAAPVSTDGTITIRNGHIATLTLSKALDQLVVDAGGTLTVNTGQTLTINNGSGTDLNVTGTINNSGTITPIGPIGSIVFNVSSAYNHTQDGGTVPDATWNATSNCNITGVTVTVPTIEINQSFGNFTWNCTGQTGTELNINPLSVSFGDAVTGDFTLASTGTGSVRLANITPRVLDISGDFNISGGTFIVAILTGSGTVNVGGDFNMTGGTITETGSSSGLFIFDNGGATQNFRRTVGTISNNIGFTVNLNVNIDFGTSDYANGAGTFTLSNGATLQTANPSGVNGSIQFTSRSLSTSANYTFDGTAAQVTGTYLPATVNNFKINNANGIILTNNVTIAGTLYMNSGNITTGVNTFILSNPLSSALNYTAGIIVGRFERFINTTSVNYFSPVGTTAQIQSLTTNFINLTAGSLLVQYITGDPGNSGLPLSDGDGSQITNQFTSGYWSALAKNSLASTNYNIDLNATGFGPYIINAGTRLIKRTDAGGSWLLNGTHSGAVSSVVKRTGMSGIYNAGGGTQFGIGKSGPGITTQPSNKTVCENAGTNFSVTASGYPTLSYQWYKAPGTLLTNDGHYGGVTTSALSITTVVIGDAGNYYCIVTDGNGSTVQSTSATFTVNALPVATASNNGPVCVGSALSLTGGPAGMTTYSWTGPNAFTSLLQNPTISANATLAMAGVYTLTVTNTSGCTNTATATVIVNVLPVATASNNGPVCVGSALSLTGGPAGMTTYSWTGPNGFTSLLQNPTVGANATLAMAGVYTLTVTNASGCISATTTTVTVNALSIATVSNNGPVCAGSALNLTGGPAGMTTYSWTGPNGFTSLLQSPAVSANTTLAMAGVYTLSVTNAPGCTNTASTTVVVNALPVATATNNGPVCAGSALNLTGGPAGMTTYSWTGPNGFTSLLQNPTVGVNATLAMAGVYTLTITNTSGCISTATTTVTVNALPIATVSNNGPVCAGSALSLTGGPAGMTTYSWTGPDGFTSASQSPSVSASATTTMAGVYTLTITNANGCTGTATMTKVVNVLPVATASNNGPVCAGSVLSLTGGPAGMTTYSWTGPGGFASILQNPSVSTNADIAMSGVYALTITNANGCTNTATTTVTINALPLVNITSSSSPMCINDLRTLTGSPSGGTFSISGGPGTITGNVLTATGSGNINLEYNYINVCSNKATQSIIVNETPVVNAGPDEELIFVFETQMKAEILSSETGEWSLVSGAGNIVDIHSPTTRVTELSIGENIFLWKVLNGSCEASAEVKITVYDLFVPSVITPNGDGKNDYFKISENIGNVELIIFNRWGNEEYKNGDYKNDWDGRNIKGAELPNDTYFYVLKFENGKIKKGSVLIKR